jgi:ankyrin repeat protein
MGADYEKRDDMNRTPLYYAALNCHKETFYALLRLGAEPWGVQTEDE